MRIVVALVLAFITYFAINFIGEIGHLDTTGQADPLVKIIAVIAAIVLFILVARKSPNSN